MLNQKVKHKKGEKKISISKTKKKESKKEEENIFEKGLQFRQSYAIILRRVRSALSAVSSAG